MITSKFLEEYSLFRKLKGKMPQQLNQFKKVPIHMFCMNCESDQTFAMVNQFSESHVLVYELSGDRKIKLSYNCKACETFQRVFYLYIDPNLQYIYKIGQYPEWEIKIDKTIESILGKHVSNFKKGLVCESQSYGIGAFAYYRRITEEIIDELLDSIVDLIDPDNLEKYEEALVKTKKTRVAQEKIDLIKDLLPSILRPGGMNPLGVLHSELSEGIHSMSDEDCLEHAHHIKDILTFLLTQIKQTKEHAKTFTTSMKKLLDKKSNSGT